MSRAATQSLLNAIAPGEYKFAGTATFSACNRYRYTLTREWDDNLPPVVFIMLNPSTADASVDDPTIRRCIGFAKSWGHGSLIVRNIFALRSTDPKQLYVHPSPISEPSDWWRNSSEIAATDCRIIAAWGNHGALMNRGRDVMKLLIGVNVECLGVTKAGHPKHPLYIAASTKPIPFGGVK